MTSERNQRVLEQFRIQAATFTDTGFAAAGLGWILEQLAPRPGEQVLDVAAGAGHLGRALAPEVPTPVRDEIRERLDDEIAGGAPTGLRRAGTVPTGGSCTGGRPWSPDRPGRTPTGGGTRPRTVTPAAGCRRPH